MYAYLGEGEMITFDHRIGMSTQTCVITKITIKQYRQQNP